MNLPQITDLDDINVLVASPLLSRCTEVARVLPLERGQFLFRPADQVFHALLPAIATTAIMSASVPKPSS